MGTVYIRNKMRFNMRMLIRFQCFCHHYRTKIAPSNTNIDKGFYWFTSITFPFSIGDLLRENLHFIQHLIDLWHYILSFYINGIIGSVSQCSMKNWPSFSAINGFAYKHILNRFTEVGLICQIEKGRKNFLIYSVFGIIE